MEQAKGSVDPVEDAPQRKDTFTSSTIIGAHILQHLYGNGFLVLLPAIYSGMGLVPIQAGLIELVRRLSGGVATMGGGVIVDRMQRRRGPMLVGALALMGVGYLIVGLVPSYYLILIAVGFAGAAGSLWHPPALSLLSQRFPKRRGFVISLHRSAGSIGDSAGPLVAGALLLVISWQLTLQLAFPLTFAAAILVWVAIRHGGEAWKRLGTSEKRTLVDQMRSLGGLFHGWSLTSLLIVAGVRGMADRSLLLFLPLYLGEERGMGSFLIGVHVALLTTLAIVGGPAIGWLSDRIGRKPIIVVNMAISTGIGFLMIMFDQGAALTVLVAGMGFIMFSVNSLTQAGAIDLAEGRGLEGSMIGLLWGSNAAFGAISPLLMGALAGWFGFQVVFLYATVLYAVGTLISLTLPAGIERTRRGTA
jgi:FSR family fosmidomycin resistance protein-like MFS transporter